MIMANSTVASPLRSSASLRKTNKPLMEKRRRARINDSLTQLKSLVISGTKKDSSQFNKLEKADILELTVKHLRNLQTQQQLQQQQQQQQQQLPGSEPTMGPKYQDGFMECANEVIRYLGQTQGFTDDTKCRVINHLASCIQLATNKASLAKVMQANTVSAPSAIPAQSQIIQIVPFQTGKPQNVQILPSPTVIPSPPTTSPAATTVPAQIPAPQYAQPLHIQIPPSTFSPVLIANSKTNTRPLAQKQQEQQHQAMDIAPRLAPTVTNTAYLPSKHTVQDSNPQVRLPTPPAPKQQQQQPQHEQQQDTPITHVHKIHGFYSSSEDFIPSRPRTYSATSSSSSSSSSSTSGDNDLASPLNLSQSPTHFSAELRRKNGDGPMKPRHFMDRNKNSSSGNVYSMNLPYCNTSDSDQENIGSSNSNIMRGEGCSPSQVFSMRKPGLEAPSYMSMMMEEDRQCTRNQGHRSRSTSPASSVGEERLWRPW